MIERFPRIEVRPAQREGTVSDATVETKQRGPRRTTAFGAELDRKMSRFCKTDSQQVALAPGAGLIAPEASRKWTAVGGAE